MSDFSKENTYLNPLAFFYKNRKVILVIGIISCIASGVISFIIPVKYKSTVILFPAASSSISKSLMTENASAESDLLQFGEEEDSERMLQILQSDEIRDKIAAKYKLMEHYGIDTESPYKKTFLKDEFESNIQFKKTEFVSVKIEVLDSDPILAANIANDIASLFDSTITRMKRERAIDAFKIVEGEYLSLQKEKKAKEDSLNKLMQLGVNDYESQAERMNEALGKAIVEGRTSAIAELEQKMKTLSLYGTAYTSLRDNLIYLREQISMMKTKYEQAKVDAGKNISEKFVVNRAFPSDRKAYPVRWLIIVSSTLSAMIVAMLALAILDNFKRIKNQIIS